MFDGVHPAEFSPGLPRSSTIRRRAGRPVAIAIILALVVISLGAVPALHPFDGPHIEFMGP